jgi:hypothetical protein
MDTNHVNEGETFDAGYCLGFVDATAHELDGMATEIAKMQNTPKTVCFPDQATSAQFVRVIVKYLEDHPADLHKRSWTLANLALIQAFPCKQ